MAFLRAKPIGVMQMIDQGEQDDKVRLSAQFVSWHLCISGGVLLVDPGIGCETPVPSALLALVCQLHSTDSEGKGCVFGLQIIAVHADDPEFKGFEDIAQLPKHRLAEIRRCG